MTCHWNESFNYLFTSLLVKLGDIFQLNPLVNVFHIDSNIIQWEIQVQIQLLITCQTIDLLVHLRIYWKVKSLNINDYDDIKIHLNWWLCSSTETVKRNRSLLLPPSLSLSIYIYIYISHTHTHEHAHTHTHICLKL